LWSGNAETAAKPVTWAKSALKNGFSVFDFADEHHRNTRTSYMPERLYKEVKRRTKVAGKFLNEDSCLRLASAVLMEISEK
jgi:transposase-like protein